MKTKKVFLGIAAAALMMGFGSCTKEASVASEDEGKATMMTVLITFPKDATRNSTEDPNGTPDESKVNTVDVFIYTEAGNFSSMRRLNGTDFDQGTSTSSADVYVAKVKIPTTTGTKNVLAGINLPETAVDAVKDKPMSALASVIQTMTRAELAGTENFAMFSTDPVAKTLVDENDANYATNNRIILQCKRLVAKVTVETRHNVDMSGVPGTLSKLEFAVNNFNNKLFLLQGAVQLFKDPNWASGSYNSADFNQAVDTDYAVIMKRVAGDDPLITDYKPRYAAENTSEGKLKGEITRVTVRAKFIPNDIVEFFNGIDNAGGYKTNSAHGIDNPKTFYAVTPSLTDGTYYFYDLDVAQQFATDKGVNHNEIDTYTDGYCYWDIFLNKNPLSPVNQWDVLRNDFYKCIITRISGLGRSDPMVPDPGVTPETETDITTEIQIMFWHTPIDSEYILE